MNKIDRRINYRIVLDVETAPMHEQIEGEQFEKNALVYDLGYAVVDKHGNVYKSESFVNADIFIDEADLMKSAYYAEKIPQYRADLKNGTRRLATMKTIRKTFLEDIKTYEVEEIYAHNMKFDYTALTNTERWLTKSAIRYFFPRNVVICDTLKMAQDILGAMPTYRRFCETNGFMTKHKTPRPRFTAEVIHRFLTNDLTFEESHTGLEDVMIEKDILAYCYRQHKAMRKRLWED